ncbi:LOW QUALITY PROTEIN: hypothetical protein ACHAW6_013882 [Cyclotella cf. meneghiniana]
MKLRLPAAIRHFCGSIRDIVLMHGISTQSVDKSAYGVINVANLCPQITLNKMGMEFPSHAEQCSIAKGFKRMSAA